MRLGHEGRHDAKARTDFLRTGLEQDRAVGLFQRLAEADGRFIHTRPGLGVQAFNRHAEGQHVVHQRIEIPAVLVHPQERVAEHARRERLRHHALLGGPALRRFKKVVPLELHPRHDLKAHLFGALQYLLQGLSWAQRMRRAVSVDELAQEEVHVVVPRHLARGIEVQAGQRVGVAMLPAGHCRVVVGGVGHVPAEHHIAEAEAALGVRLGRAEELVAMQVLAAQHAVDVTDCHLDFGRAGLLDRRYGWVEFAACHGPSLQKR